MLAVIFHWWLGVGFTIIGILTALAMVAGYLKKVTLPQYPGKRNREE
jgi:hypothetical protein